MRVMKNKKVLTLAMLAGLTLGGLSVASVASAHENKIYCKRRRLWNSTFRYSN